MASKARKAFDDSAQDVKRLLEIHTQVGGAKKGRRYRLEVLNRSAIVLITAIWEAYCEDIVSEAVEHIVTHVSSPDLLPKEMMKTVAKELKNEDNEIAVWQLAGAGWKDVLLQRLQKFTEERNRKLNTPKAAQIREFFGKVLGIEDITSAWKSPEFGPVQAAEKLDEFISLRGEIAHRGRAGKGVTKSQVEEYLAHVTLLVAKTGGRIQTGLKQTTGTPLWLPPGR